MSSKSFPENVFSCWMTTTPSTAKEVHNLLIELARHWPKPLHLVLISRIDPPLPLTRLRAKGMLSEIRTQDLRFTPEETAAYLSQTQFAPLSQTALHLLEERFEGWPAGLHLAALSLRSAGSQESVLSALSSENPNITGYLVDEVLTHQFPAIHSFLLKTSILDRFCASLCEAIIGEIDTAWNARACLDWIERSELFLIPLDDRREWYRYHHLFQESAAAESPPPRWRLTRWPTCIAGLQPGSKSTDCSMKPCSTPWQPATLIWLRAR